MYEELLLAVDEGKAQVVPGVGLPELGLEEVKHLQEWVLANPDLLGPGVEVVTSEFNKWQTAKGDPVHDRLDVLGLGPDGRLVVAELKRDYAPHTIHMQAVNYAAMVSRLSLHDVAELWAAGHGTPDHPLELESVLTQLQTERLLTPESIKSPRIVLVASGFPVSATASVVWLNEQGVDIDLIRFRSYQLADGQTVVSFTKLYPVPSVEDFTVGRRANQPASEPSGPGLPWDLAALQRLAQQGNAATLAMLDLCAAEEAQSVSVADIAEQAGITTGQVKGQLAGLTMRLKNPNYGFPQNRWPVEVDWQPGGIAAYRMSKELATIWKAVRTPSEVVVGASAGPSPAAGEEAQ